MAVTDVVENEDISDETEEDDLVSAKLGYNKYMVTNVWNAGIVKLNNDNIPKKPQDTFILVERKRRVNMIVLCLLNEDTNKSCLSEKWTLILQCQFGLSLLFPYFLIFTINYLNK